jgi:hypothetical protein
MGLQRAVVAHGGHRLNVFYFHWIPQRSLGNEACNTRPELSSQIEGVGSLIFPIDLKQGNFLNLRKLPVLIRTVIKTNNNL